MPHRILEAPARAAVVESSIEIEASPERCFDVFFDGIRDWFFETEETKSVRPARIERKLGGRFYVEYADGTENLLAIVTMIKPGRELRLKGDFTVPQAFTANVTVRFQAGSSGTLVAIEHRMSGEFDEDIPAGFDEGWTDGLEKLKTLVESDA
jgi:uncharacterized protein YndB with AHSA1/START domain